MRPIVILASWQKNRIRIRKNPYSISECSGNHLLHQFDICLSEGLTRFTRIINVDMNDDQWLEDSQPVRNGELGIRNATTLASSIFLESATSTCSFHHAILPQCFRALDDISQTHYVAIWKSLSSSDVPAPRLQHVQKAWNGPLASRIQAVILGRASDVNVKARLLAAVARLISKWTF